MTEDILNASGITYREARFIKPPGGTYAVWFDDVDTDGPDNINAVLRHSVTVELYASAPDAAAEAALEAAIDAVGLRWTKQPRYWIQAEQYYQTIYEFNYIEKRRIS